MKYKEQLKDPRWQRKRVEILTRDEHTCVICGDKGHLHIHHKKYTGNAWDADNKDLIAVCRQCHSIIHKVGERFDDYTNIKKIKHSIGNDNVYIYLMLCDKHFTSFTILNNEKPKLNGMFTICAFDLIRLM